MPWACRTHGQKARAGRARRRMARNRSGDPFYSGRRWRRLREQFLRRYPLCGDPWGYHRRDGELVEATDVDHIKRRSDHPELEYEWTNLQALCHSCHAKKTAQEGKQGSRNG